ncbi:class I SAM-dependent methyltransferase [Saccharothrix sp. NRRL B-16348]|uniref:class I SAM-dependent methyltransferase n=1 Tax=Saccharothrix sp. NRRL B-16348 TaxID=1415542 RepID=UPI0012FAC864|nr:methyltransferase domain-containing protein [Saccharothrix sp. NRRL B-16348]
MISWSIGRRCGDVPPEPDSSADVAVENDYDAFAEGYAAENETSLVNAYYVRPAIVDLAGRRILDAGWGPGTVALALRDRGAVVAGFDRSAKMVEPARRRLGDDADLRVLFFVLDAG